MEAECKRLGGLKEEALQEECVAAVSRCDHMSHK